MTAQPFFRLYVTYQTAAETVRELEAAGVRKFDLSIVANHFVSRGTNGMTPDRLMYAGPENSSKVGAGSAVDATIGAGAGLLAGLDLLTVPDIGPVVAAGWLISSAAGSAAGFTTCGLTDALTGNGADERHARLLANGVRGGATLVAVRRNDGAMQNASTQPILQRHGPIDPEIYDKILRYGT